MHANVRDDRCKSRETLPLWSTSRPENDRHRGGIARHGVGPFRHGSSIQQPEALARHGHRHETRGLTDARTLRRWRKTSECFAGDRYLVNVGALRAFERAKVETHAS